LPPQADQLKGNLSGAGIEASKRIVPVVRDAMQRIASLCIDGKLTSMFGKVAMDTRMQWVQQLARAPNEGAPGFGTKILWRSLGDAEYCSVGDGTKVLIDRFDEVRRE